MRTKLYFLTIAVFVTALFSGCDKKPDPAPELYTITITDDGNGTAEASVAGRAATSAAAGKTVTLTATPNEGYAFVRWTVISGGITLENATENPATFIMPAQGVEITAEFGITANTNSITVTSDGNGIVQATVGGSPVTEASAGMSVTITATPDEGWFFAGWTVESGDVVLQDAAVNPATFVMPDGSVAIKAEFISLPASTIYYFTEFDNNPTVEFHSTTFQSIAGGTKLGSATADVQCMEYVDGVLYGITYNSSNLNDLVTVNPADGTLTTVKANIAADGIGLALNPLTGTVYVSTWDKEFGTIDLATGGYTRISTLGATFTIAIDNDGVCYAQSLSGGGTAMFGTIDLTTGAFTQITTRSFNVNYVQNMAIDRQSNGLYWMQRGSSTNRRLMYVDKVTGECYDLGEFPRTVESAVIISE